MDYEKQIEIIKECAGKAQPGIVTVLTGKNGSGKSMLRRLVGYYIAEKLGLDGTKPCSASVSMESRTQRKFEFSALNSAGIDDPTNPTSQETMYQIDSLVKSACQEGNGRYLIIDEPEIGMGEEMVAALVIKLNKMFNPIPVGCLGVLIITHNRYVVKNITGDFVNMEGMTKEEWLNREIVPTDLDEFNKDSLGLFRAINQRIEKNKK